MTNETAMREALERLGAPVRIGAFNHIAVGEENYRAMLLSNEDPGCARILAQDMQDQTAYDIAFIINDAFNRLQSPSEADAVAMIGEMMNRHVENWPSPKKLTTAIALINKALLAALTSPLKHDFWRAGEPDCPREIKAGNGELRTLRCKRCGLDSPRDDICRTVLQPEPLSEAVAALVIAAREAWEENGGSGDDLDKALEKFAAIVPYENEPAAHPQASPPPVQGEVAITREMFDFLCGSGPLEGYHFGEANPNERGAFWWRKRLLSLAHSQTDTQEGETERALRIGWWNDMRARGVSQDVAIRKINDALSAQAQTIGGGE